MAAWSCRAAIAVCTATAVVSLCLASARCFHFDRQRSLATAPQPPPLSHSTSTVRSRTLAGVSTRRHSTRHTAARPPSAAATATAAAAVPLPSPSVAMMKGLEDDEGPETSLRKLTQTFGVLGYVVLNKSGIPVKFHGMENAEAVHYGGLVSELVRASREFLDKKLFRSDDSTDLDNIRLRTRKHEIVIAPEEHYTLVVIHNPNYTEPVAAKPVVPTLTEPQGE